MNRLSSLFSFVPNTVSSAFGIALNAKRLGPSFPLIKLKLTLEIQEILGVPGVSGFPDLGHFFPPCRLQLQKRTNLQANQDILSHH